MSVIKIPGPEWATYQIGLLNAAKTDGIKRFAPAESETSPLSDGRIDIIAGKTPVWEA
jgi:hypothetical protein